MDFALKSYLDSLGISYKLHTHSAVFSVSESKKIIRNKIPGVRTKSLFLKDENNRFYLVWMPGEKRLNMKNLRNKLNIKEVYFASPEELKSNLYVAPGSVSPLALLNAKNTKLIVDAEIFDAEIVDFHPNINTESLEVKNEGIKKLYSSFKCEKEILEL